MSEYGQMPERRATDGLDWRERQPEQVQTAPPEPPVTAPRPSRISASTLAMTLGSGLVGGLVVLAGVWLMDSPGTGNGSSSGLVSLGVEQSSAVTETAATAREGVVRIESTRRTANGVEQDVGSGVLIDTEGHIVTNAHVVLGTETLKVFLADGSERPAILLGHDYPFTDIAVLQIGPSAAKPLPFGRSALLRLGEPLIAIGNPLSDFAGSVTVGVVSGLDRTRQFDGVLQTGLIQTDAAVNNGNSGGALLNLSGQLVGIPTAVLRQSRSGVAVEGIAFALPADRVRPIVEQIIKTGQSYPRPSLGIDHADLTPEMVSRNPRLAVERGALVLVVAPGGPAETAGILSGDVIVKVDGTDVNAAMPLLSALSAFKPGDSVKVVLNRNGRIIETDVRLAKRG